MHTVNDGAEPNIPILFEDGDVVVIDKPAGLPVHGAHNKDHVATIASWHLNRVPSAALAGEPLMLPDGTMLQKPGIVHRLDQETSGVLILAKHQDAFLFLKAQFKERLAAKEYRTFVYGLMGEERGIISRPIGRSRKDSRMRSAQRGARGTLRDALTRWQRRGEGEGCSYLSVFPETGRTHQIRVHLKAINHPVVCDRLYAKNHQPMLGFSRLALHAHSLTITVPGGERRTFTAPLPEDFLAAERFMN